MAAVPNPLTPVHCSCARPRRPGHLAADDDVRRVRADLRNGLVALSRAGVWRFGLCRGDGVGVLYAGAGAGNWHVGRRLDRGAPAGRTFGLLQGVLGLYMAASPGVYAMLVHVAHAAARNMPDGAPGFTGHVLRFGLALAALALPSYCIGGTFPALVAGPPALGGQDRAVAWVYGLNTFGGVLGAILAGFFLIPYVGMSGSLYLAAGIVWLAGASTWATTRGPSRMAAAGKAEPVVTPRTR